MKGAALARSIEEHISSSSASVSDVISTSSPRSSEHSDSSTFRRSYRFIPSSLILDYSYLLGLCGCCTTYGSMMSYALTLFINPYYYNVSQNTPSTFESFSDAVFSLVASIVISAGSFRFFLYAGKVAPIQLRLKYLFLVGGLSPLLIGAILIAVNGERETIKIRTGNIVHLLTHRKINTHIHTHTHTFHLQTIKTVPNIVTAVPLPPQAP